MCVIFRPRLEHMISNILIIDCWIQGIRLGLLRFTLTLSLYHSTTITHSHSLLLILIIVKGTVTLSTVTLHHIKPRVESSGVVR